MINNKRRMSVSFIPSFQCNLKCSYCYISKTNNCTMSLIEQDLIKSFESPGYYLNLYKERFNGRSIKQIEFWGGEPLLHLERTFPTIIEFIDNYPEISEFVFSSNFSHSRSIPSIKGLIELLSAYKDRKFNIRCQISIDGPRDINDANRGIGVTNNIIRNLEHIGSVAGENILPFNVSICIQLKSTLSHINFNKMMDIDYCTSYFKFIDGLYEIMHKSNVKYEVYKSSVVSPYDYSTEDGIIFAQFIQNCITLTKSNSFSFIKRINPYIEMSNHNPTRLCGVDNNINLLPNDLTFVCHRAIDYVISYYENNMNLKYNRFVFKDLYSFEDKYSQFYRKYRLIRDNPDLNISDSINHIRTLAYLGEIDPTYKDPQCAYNAARYFNENIGKCIIACQGMNDTMNIESSGPYRLFFNGAHKLIEAHNLVRGDI